MSQEPLLVEHGNRFCLYPIQFPDIWEAYKKHKSSFWTAEEIDFTADKNDWNRLSKDEKYFIEHILAFFAGSDGIVLENLVVNFCKEIPIAEVRCYYAFQAMMENIHCVHKDTNILTDNGYFRIQDLENQNVNIWNGNEFSNVLIKYTGHQDIYKVRLSNGMELDCSPKHKWLIHKNNQKIEIETINLNIGDFIQKYSLPIIEFKNKNQILPNLDIVPINFPIIIRKEWLEHIINDVGIYSKYEGIIIPDKNYKFLLDIQLLLTTLGVFSNVYKDYLVIPSISINKLQLNINMFIDQSCYIYYDNDIQIVSIDKIGENEPTYCFNEPKRHMGIFNGILTCQSEVYSLLIDTYVEDPNRRTHLFNAINEIECVKYKADWSIKYMEPQNASFAKRLVAFGIVEGLFFSGAFCAIFWLKQRGIMTKSLGKSNEWICRDEGLHTSFAVLLYKYIINKLPQEEIFIMMDEAVKIEENFICKSLPCRLIGMNQELMCEYIHFVADRLLIQFGYKKLYNAKNPFPFMDTISLEGKTNFFEQRVTEYVLSSSVSNNMSFNIQDLEKEDF